MMSTIETYDHLGGDYLDETPGGIFGGRLHRDRRYWLAWASVDLSTQGDCLPGVMDDYGTLTPVPSPRRQPQH
ncbi:hypothetical protein ACM1PE_08820 [Achromobacter sp. PD1]|jgi:hypothetical protein|uniref:hypothetical protein n=1 Tax=Achromobacter sp. PD1 TaxID=3399125 RepID=UPI003AF4A646